jgi:protein-L-isoaspartate(D-aspartate) O-methyltransferase
MSLSFEEQTSEPLVSGNGNHEALGHFILNLRTRGFRDTVLLNAIERAPRTDFLPLEYIGFAYHGLSVPLPCGQEAGSPVGIIEAIGFMQIEPHHHILEIGTGSGWQTALLASLAKAVVSVERWKTMADAADARLLAAGYANVVVAHGDGSGGMPAAAPFDRIIFNAAIEDVSPLIEAQLTEGGILLAPVESDGQQFLVRFEKQGDRLVQTPLGPANFAPIVSGTADYL